MDEDRPVMDDDDDGPATKGDNPGDCFCKSYAGDVWALAHVAAGLHHPGCLLRPPGDDTVSVRDLVTGLLARINFLEVTINGLKAAHERSRDRAADQVSRWMECAEVEHNYRLAAEAERDALLGRLVQPIRGKFETQIEGRLLGRFDTREDAVRACRKAAGLDPEGGAS
jgi:hypothetical protein